MVVLGEGGGRWTKCRKVEAGGAVGSLKCSWRDKRSLGGGIH